jgi:hypothetical protein
LAVFIGAGRSGWEQVSRTGQLGKETQRILASQYVCVYVDSAEPGGQRLASAFEIPQGLGLVISDRSGERQAFHHPGDLAAPDLQRSLQRYTDRERPLRVTETNGTRQVSYYPDARAVAPQWAAPVSAPVYFGGGRSC